MHKYIFLFNYLNKFFHLVIFIIIIIYGNFNYSSHLFLLYYICFNSYFPLRSLVPMRPLYGKIIFDRP